MSAQPGSIMDFESGRISSIFRGIYGVNFLKQLYKSHSLYALPHLHLDCPSAARAGFAAEWLRSVITAAGDGPCSPSSPFTLVWGQVSRRLFDEGSSASMAGGPPRPPWVAGGVAFLGPFKL